MARIVFIGAGSLKFTRSLIRDILSFPLLSDATIVLMDINKEKLDFSTRAVQDIIDRGKYKAKLEVTMDRKKALKKADAVVCAILGGGVQVWRHDIEIPEKYGVDLCMGDTRGPGGIFRALRTIPAIIDICKDMEKLCPNAILLNYTNPQATICRAIQRSTWIKSVGLCHSIQGTVELLSRWISVPREEISYACAGINHQAWFIKFERNGKDLYPLLRKAVQKKDIYSQQIVRNEMLLHLGYYVAESSGHNSEYNWWFRKRPDLIEKYCLAGTGKNPGKHGNLLNEYLSREKTWKKDLNKWINDKDSFPLTRGQEYAAGIINAYMGGEPFRFHGNVANTGLVTNLMQNACVEVPVFADKRGYNPVYVGALPPQLAALNNVNIASDEMAVEAYMTRNPELVFHAMVYDPLTAAVLTLAEIKKMVNEMLKKNRKYLTYFKSTSI